jgi:serine/threonine-protein kinase
MPGPTQTRPADGREMVYVPASEFQMGSEDGADDEKPVHTVALDAFWIDKHEVTNEQFGLFVAAEGYRTEAEKVNSDWAYYRQTHPGAPTGIEVPEWQHPSGPDSGLEGLADHPVVQVTRKDARAYCTWAGAGLPTEAQWEYAARGSEGRVFPWGDAFDGSRLNYCDTNCASGWADKAVDDGYGTTAPVGSYPQGESWVGALDLSGNVWEWVADWYGAYPAERQEDPTGPSAGEDRVLRGGSWVSEESYMRGANRYRIVPEIASEDIGFRCARGSE